MNLLRTEHDDATRERARARLWQAFARSIRNNILGEIGVQITRIAAMVVLARALAPSDFGLFRVLVVVAGVAMVIDELGVVDTLVQRGDLRPEHEIIAVWANLTVSFLTAALLYATAPLIARAMAMAALVPLLRLLCIPLVFEGLASVSAARLIRRLDFAKVAMAEVVAELAFITVAIGLLIVGMPRWSLAGGLAARLCGHALTLFSAEPYLPHGRPSWRVLGELRGFAAGVMGSRLLSMVSSNADYLMVGRLLGTSALGLYSLAWDLLRFVPDRLYKVAGRVTVSAFSRMQDQPEDLRRAFLNFLGYVGRVILPILVCVAIAAPELLRGIYGAQWLPAATPMRILSVGLIGVGLRAGMGAVYYAKGRPILDVFLHSLRLILIVVAVLWTARHGLVAVSVAMSLVELTISGIGQTVACSLIGTDWSHIFVTLQPSFKTAAACAAGALAGRLLAVSLNLQGAIAVALIVLPAAAAFLWLEAATARELVASAFNATHGAKLAGAGGEQV